VKPIWWGVIGFVVSIVLIGINITIIIVADTRWVWILPSILAVVIGWSIVGISMFIIRLRKKPIVRQKLDIGTARKKAVTEVMMDEDNPDNFVIDKQVLGRKGEPGSEKTPIVWFQGKGTETSKTINILTNLNDPKGESIRIDDAPDDKIETLMEQFAENPDVKVIEERIQSMGQWGQPEIKTTITRSAGKKEDKEEEEAKKSHAM